MVHANHMLRATSHILHARNIPIGVHRKRRSPEVIIVGDKTSGSCTKTYVCVIDVGVYNESILLSTSYILDHDSALVVCLQVGISHFGG